jgi:hypothetical protein
MNVAEHAYALGVRKASIGFSTGKDSVVGMDMLIKAGIEPYPIYFYIVPGLEFVENNIRLYEQHFDTKIHQLPHPICYDYLRSAVWQPYDKARLFAEVVNMPVKMFYELTQQHLEENGIEDIEFDCNCMKMADSLNRRLLLRSKPDVDTEKKIIYLTKYLTDTGCFEYMKTNGIPLTEDYKAFGRSWDGLSYQFLYGVKKFYPKDYERIQEMFPLIDAEIFRYKMFNKHKFENQ